jgi:hypothetical protein
VLGVGEDAFVLPRGMVRVGVVGSWDSFEEMYRADESGRPGDKLQPFGSSANVDVLGAAQVPFLAPIQNELRALTGGADLAVSLGQTRVQASADVRTTTFSGEVGLARWLSFGVSVPWVVTRTDVVLDANAGESSANLGFNPARASEAAAAANAALTSQLGAAAAELSGLVATCDADPAADARCGVVVAARDEALALIAGSSDFATGVENVYGVGTTDGSLYVPLAGSAAQQRIEEQVGSFRTRYQNFQVANAITANGPAAAAAAAGADAIRTVLIDPTFGVGIDTLQTAERAHVGDIEVGLKLKLLDSFGRDPRARLTPTGFNYRLAVAGIVRLGTGEPALANNPVDIGRGDGQNDVEIRPSIDLLFGRRVWTSVAARVGFQQKDRLVAAIAGPNDGIVPAYAYGEVERKLGDYFEIEASPRYSFNDYFALSANYRYRHKAEDAYTGQFTVDSATTGIGAIDLDASVIGMGSEQTEHRVGGGIAFSTLGAYYRGRARLPVEISYTHVQTVRGTGGDLPRLTVDQVQLRVYTRLFGGPR